MFIDHYDFFVNSTATTEIYTLSLHDALPISAADAHRSGGNGQDAPCDRGSDRGFGTLSRRNLLGRVGAASGCRARSEEHTSELQSRFDLVCRLLLEKKNKIFTV